MPFTRVQSAETRTKGRRDSVISIPERRKSGDGKKEIPQDRLHGTRPLVLTQPTAGKRANVQGAARAWIRMGGKKSIEKLREIEWL